MRRSHRLSAISFQLLAAVGVGIAVCLILGCAQPKRLAAVKPSHDELPVLAEIQPSAQQASVKVQGRDATGRTVLVPEFKEPPLTPEERAALGEKEPLVKLLQFEDLTRVPGSPVAGWAGGVDTHAAGYGRPATAYDIASVTTAQRGMCPAGIGIGGRAPPVGNLYHPTPPGAHPGPEERVTTAVDRPSHVARAQTRRDE